MFSDFKRAFKRIDDLKNIKVIDNCPCRTCEYKKEYHLKWDKVPHYWEHPEVGECKSCTKYANYLMDVQEKLKWYEDNDNNLSMEIIHTLYGQEADIIAEIIKNGNVNNKGNFCEVLNLEDVDA